MSEEASRVCKRCPNPVEGRRQLCEGCRGGGLRGRLGSTARAVQTELEQLGGVAAFSPALARSALALAEAIDDTSSGRRDLAGLARELRTTMGELRALKVVRAPGAAPTEPKRESPVDDIAARRAARRSRSAG
jgi:hypothetical protein